MEEDDKGQAASPGMQGSSSQGGPPRWKVSEVLHPPSRVKTLDGWTLSPSDHASASKKQSNDKFDQLQHEHELLKIENEELQLLLDSSLLDIENLQSQLAARPDAPASPESPHAQNAEVEDLRAELAASRAEVLEYERRAETLLEVAKNPNLQPQAVLAKLSLTDLNGGPPLSPQGDQLRKSSPLQKLCPRVMNPGILHGVMHHGILQNARPSLISTEYCIAEYCRLPDLYIADRTI
ncbi:hypothetical protein T484DRAFT_3628469 [Baffinella frigidus]|nr:hypothetical protein T484DRAFT_3628469 [Cryptophyta sp. CCMP2293]